MSAFPVTTDCGLKLPKPDLEALVIIERTAMVDFNLPKLRPGAGRRLPYL
jgi:hypothetical protein